MRKRKIKTLLDKYLNKTATQAETFIVESWYESFDRDAVGNNPFNDPNVIKGVKSSILSMTVEKAADNRNYIRIGRIAWAACLVLAVGIAVVFYQHLRSDNLQPQRDPSFQVVKTQFGETKQITLIDGTVITINANSELRVQDDFNKGDRNVQLDGEAFFQVARDTASPFIVETPTLNVKVLGTSFNLKSRKQLGRETVRVYTGKVQVANETINMGVLERQQQLVYDKEAKSEAISEMQENQQPEWKTGQAILDDVSFQELDNEFYNTYGAHLLSRNRDVLAKKYNLTLRTARTMEESLDVLCKIIKKKYRKEGNDIIIY